MERRVLIGSFAKKRCNSRLKDFFLVLIGGLMLAVLPSVACAQVATTTTLAVTSDGKTVTSVASGSVVTLTANVKTGTTLVTVGQVNFCDATAKYCEDIHLLGTAQLTKAGTAAYKFRPGVGSHSYKAVFAGTPKGNPDYKGSTSNKEALTVTSALPPYPTATGIAQSLSAGSYSLTATVGDNGITAPTGTVSFLDASNGDSVLGTATLGNDVLGLQFLNPDNPQTGSEPYSIAVADFNGDGIPDLAVVNSCGNDLSCKTFNGTVTILLGNGDGTFTAAPATPVTGSSPVSIAVGDFNDDGIPDLAVANFCSDSTCVTNNGTVTILLGNGDGTFKAASVSPATGIAPISISVGDFNGDGILDLAVANVCGTDASCGSFNGTVTILLGNGDGTFKASSASPATGYYPISTAAGDFNRDGIQDLAVANFYDGTVTILLGNGDGTFKSASASPIGGFYNYSIAVGDFNGDGIPDLAVVDSYDYSIIIWLEAVS